MILLVADRAWQYSRQCFAKNKASELQIDVENKHNISKDDTSNLLKSLNDEDTENVKDNLSDKETNEIVLPMMRPCPSKPIFTAETIGRIGN